MNVMLRRASFSLFFFWLFYSLWAIFHDSMVIDEAPHIAAGFAYLDVHLLTVNLTHPPLIKMIAALPLKFLSITAPPYKPADPSYVHEFFFGAHNNPDSILFLSRLAVFTFNLLLIVLCARTLHYWKNWAVNFAVCLCTLAEPTFLAHAHFVTFDVPVTALMFLSVLLALQASETGNFRRWLLCAITLCAALLTKVCAWFILPIVVFIAAVSGWQGAVTLAGAVAAAVIFYSFFSTDKLTGFYSGYTDYALQEHLPKISAAIKTLFLHSYTVPLGVMLMTFGAASIHIFTGEHALNFFNGRIYRGGDPLYFVKIFSLKEPTGLLLLLVLTAVVGVSNRAAPFSSSLRRLFYTALVFVLAYWGVVFFAKVDLGIRYLLPMYPWMGVLTGMTIERWVSSDDSLVHKKMKKLLVAGLVASQLTALLITFPSYLSFFNLPSGGIDNGYLWSQDSNYDWGQDLYRLVDWVKSEKVDKLYLDFSGSADPRYYLGGKLAQWNPSSEKPQPGSWFAISVFKLEYVRAGWLGRNYYSWLDTLKPAARAGTSILIYKIP